MLKDTFDESQESAAANRLGRLGAKCCTLQSLELAPLCLWANNWSLEEKPCCFGSKCQTVPSVQPGRTRIQLHFFFFFLPVLVPIQAAICFAFGIANRRRRRSEGCTRGLSAVLHYSKVDVWYVMVEGLFVCFEFWEKQTHRCGSKTHCRFPVRIPSLCFPPLYPKQSGAYYLSSAIALCLQPSTNVLNFSFLLDGCCVRICAFVRQICRHLTFCTFVPDSFMFSWLQTLSFKCLKCSSAVK